MNNIDREIARSRWIEAMHNRAMADDEVRRAAVPQVDLTGLTPSQALAAVFGQPADPVPQSFDPPPPDVHTGKSWQTGLRLGEMRDGLTSADPPAAPPAPAPAEPGQEPPARLADVWERLAAPAAAAPATPSSAVRRVLAGLPEAQQQEIEKAVVQRLGGLGHLPADAEAYRRSLIVGHLAGRLADARRLDPEVDPAAVIEALVPVAPPAGEAPTA